MASSESGLQDPVAVPETTRGRDWVRRFGHPLVLLETFVDDRFQGTVYQAANWLCWGLGETQGFRRTRQGYSPSAQPPKRVFVKLLQARIRCGIGLRL